MMYRCGTVLLNAFIGEVVGCKPHIGAVLNDPTACDMNTHSAACCPAHTKLQEKVNITDMSTANEHTYVVCIVHQYSDSIHTLQ